VVLDRTIGRAAQCVLLLGCLIGVSAKVAADDIFRPDDYVVRAASPVDLKRPEPRLPDLGRYTRQAIMERIPKAPPARASVQRMVSLVALEEFVKGEDKDRLAEWAARQSTNPVAIVIEGGRITLAELARQVSATYLAEKEPGVFLLRLPLLVLPDATLVIDKSVHELRLSQERGAFLVNDGHMFVLDTRITAWRESENAPASFRDGTEFRPFLVSWGGAEIYILNSVVRSLGYSASKGYGVAISQYSPARHKRLRRPSPAGWVLNSEFVDNWFGFYCYEADDLVIVGNRYRDNIVYGVDPHDRSHGLIIANNRISGTKKKHGLIISREVNNSWIFGNTIHDNALSGMVIDRNSVRNVIAENTVYDNASDGITIYESPDNLLWANDAIGNGKHGIRVRNSVRVKMYNNNSIANGSAGIYGHIKDLTGTDRDLRIDPFQPTVSMVVVGGQLMHNGSGPVSIDKPLSVELFDVDLLAPIGTTGIGMKGVLGEFQHQVLDLLVRQRLPVVIEPADKRKTPS
jgi:mannuronan 5-epimerase